MSRYKPSKNSVWLCARILNENSENPFKCPIEKIAWVNYRYSSDYIENGARVGALIDSITDKTIFESYFLISQLLKADKVFISVEDNFNYSGKDYLVSCNL